MRKLVAWALCAAMILGLSACGDSAASGGGSAAKPAAETAAEAATGAAGEEGAEAEAPAIDESLIAADGINVCIASEPDNIDPALNSAVDGATLIIHSFSGLAKWEQKDDGSFAIVPDCAEELVEGKENEDGTVTYTYTLRDGLKWSDGKPVTAGDFEFAWKRAADPATGSDYGYMFDQIVGYDEMAEAAEESDAASTGSTAGAEKAAVGPEVLAVKALDDKTLEVTTKQLVSYWNELLAFPTYMPVREDIVSNEGWATDPSTYIGNGPYKMSAWQHNSVLTMVKNENYIDADEITMPAINFYMSDDANNMLTNFENGDWLLIDDVPTNEIAALKEQYPDEFVVTGQLGTYYVCWNVNEDILPKDSGLEGAEAEAARAEIRNAIALLFDRNYIVDEISQGGELPASSFVASGLTDADGMTDFSSKAGHNDGFTGYYDVSADALESNYEAAIEVLKKYYEFDEDTKQVKNFPTLTYLYNTSDAHKAIAEYLQSALASVGITMNLENQEWNTFLNTRKAGKFSVARNGWLCDYNDPISMLDMWISGSGNNDCQLGKDAHKDVKAYSLDLTDLGLDTKVENGTWAETYDVLIADIKACTDTNIRYQLMHRAEDLLMSTGVICPLYNYTDTYMIDSSVKGFFSTPLGFKYFMYCSVE
ncbi:MAG: peptide ABC transporter substrate-binding protein [Eubacteriales bacterium]|nr:peptide ABC transporter substrate-binding protein [Eubacteriales bacterium]